MTWQHWGSSDHKGQLEIGDLALAQTQKANDIGADNAPARPSDKLEQLSEKPKLTTNSTMLVQTPRNKSYDKCFNTNSTPSNRSKRRKQP